MKQPKVEKVNLPYASTVASFYGDQGSVQNNSFLGKFFQGGRKIQPNTLTPAKTSILTDRSGGMGRTK